MATNTKEIHDPIAAHQAAADKLYGKQEKTPLPPTPGKFHSWSPARSVIDGRRDELYTDAGLNDAGVQAFRDTADALERDGLPDVFVGDLMAKVMDRHLATARLSESVDDETRIADGNRECRARAAAQYGREDADALIQRADRYVKANPRLHKLFKDYKLGSSPDVVMPLVEFVRITGWGL